MIYFWDPVFNLQNQSQITNYLSKYNITKNPKIDAVCKCLMNCFQYPFAIKQDMQTINFLCQKVIY